MQNFSNTSLITSSDTSSPIILPRHSYAFTKSIVKKSSGIHESILFITCIKLSFASDNKSLCLIFVIITSPSAFKSFISKIFSISLYNSSIQQTLEDLGKITGENVSEDIINEIFSKFCLGK